jgi:hypothetical protein
VGELAHTYHELCRTPLNELKALTANNISCSIISTASSVADVAKSSKVLRSFRAGASLGDRDTVETSNMDGGGGGGGGAAAPTRTPSPTETPRVLLLSLKTRQGAAGLTLTAANCVYLLDPSTNFGVEDQAIARIHRIVCEVFFWGPCAMDSSINPRRCHAYTGLYVTSFLWLVSAGCVPNVTGCVPNVIKSNWCCDIGTCDLAVAINCCCCRTRFSDIHFQPTYLMYERCSPTHRVKPSLPQWLGSWPRTRLKTK